MTAASVVPPASAGCFAARATWFCAAHPYLPTVTYSTLIMVMDALLQAVSHNLSWSWARSEAHRRTHDKAVGDSL